MDLKAGAGFEDFGGGGERERAASRAQRVVYRYVTCAISGIFACSTRLLFSQ